MSSTRAGDITAIRPDLERLLNRPLAGLERIGGGFNSQVYRVDAADGARFALKAYFRHANDRRDRLATEYGSFSFLWKNGVREIPEPIVADPSRGWAVYQFVDGEKIPRGQAGVEAVRRAAEFLARLRDVSLAEASRGLGVASEAFFTVGEIVDNIRARLARLDAVRSEAESYPEFRQFLDGEFKPFLEELVPWIEGRLKRTGASLAGELSGAERTLSPSDFGFHNALRQPDGRIIFLDFEYFGWDDPAKMISDFLLHPAMDLPADAKRTFASTLFGRFSDWPGLRARVELAYPLFGLKWCMIILNEFLPDQMLRRQFAATAAADRTALQRQQLDKARHMLNRIRGEYENFPYHD
jgi:hypothetical protein